MLVAYSPNVKRATVNIDARIALLLLQTRLVYANSGVDKRVRVVHSYRTSYIPLAEENPGTREQDLRRFQASNDGFADEAHGLRERYGADIVALLFQHSGSPCEEFARIINRSSYAGEVSIHAVDDTGQRLGPVTLTLEAGETKHFNSNDLRDGAPSKGLTGFAGRSCSERCAGTDATPSATASSATIRATERCLSVRGRGAHPDDARWRFRGA